MQNILGKPALGALVSCYHLDEQAKTAGEVHRILWKVFNNGALVLEKLIVKTLYRELNVAQDERSAFEFEPMVLMAKEKLKSPMGRSK
ncbi:hypothetical protein E6H36_03500 [Candidatus Bathyarchaeota archaeon]|nr:MAG: hypothetical protein E6H36_03500 [Candidatus Bathyarchaeota archaeon]TMI31765.1 MAG: hypothetical protein E6H29_03370 [Candidatus Bathyarchaeota archaeon]